MSGKELFSPDRLKAYYDQRTDLTDMGYPHGEQYLLSLMHAKVLPAATELSHIANDKKSEGATSPQLYNALSAEAIDRLSPDNLEIVARGSHRVIIALENGQLGEEVLITQEQAARALSCLFHLMQDNEFEGMPGNGTMSRHVLIPKTAEMLGVQLLDEKCLTDHATIECLKPLADETRKKRNVQTR